MTLAFFLDWLNGWKTRIFSVVVAVLGFIVLLDPTWLVDIVGKDRQGYVYIGIAVVTAILRQFTTTPAGEREKLDG